MGLLCVLPGTALAAKPIHVTIDDTLNDTICGIPVQIHSVGVLNITATADSFKVTGASTTTFTSATDQWVTQSDDGQQSGTLTLNADGTTTLIDTYKGQPEQLTTATSQIRSRDAGLISTLTLLDSGGNFISSSVVVQDGPHPESDSDFTLFCQVVTAAFG